MSINNWERHKASMWDWGFLDDVLPGRVRMGDIDGMLERRGHFLFVETKLPYVPLPQGQRIALESLAQQPNTTVIVAWGRPQRPEQLRIIDGYQDKIIPATVETLQEYVNDWYRHANRTQARHRTSFT